MICDVAIRVVFFCFFLYGLISLSSPLLKYLVDSEFKRKNHRAGPLKGFEMFSNAAKRRP